MSDELPDGRLLTDLKVSELRDELSARNLPKVGVKAVLQQRLREFLNGGENGEQADENEEEVDDDDADETPDTSMDQSLTKTKSGNEDQVAEYPVEQVLEATAGVQAPESVNEKSPSTPEKSDSKADTDNAAARAAADDSATAAAAAARAKEDDVDDDLVKTASEELRSPDRKVVKMDNKENGDRKSDGEDVDESQSSDGDDEPMVVNTTIPAEDTDEASRSSPAPNEPKDVEKEEEVDADAPVAKDRKRKWGSTTTRLVKKEVLITENALKNIIKDVAGLDGDASADVELDYDEQPDPEKPSSNKARIVVKDDEQDEQIQNDDDSKPEVKRRVISRDRKDSRTDVVELTEAKPNGTVSTTSIGLQREKSLSPSRHPESSYIHIRCLTRPYALPALHQLLHKFGDYDKRTDFWIDNIKSNCIIKYNSTEAAAACREGLHNVRWPEINPKCLRVTFSEAETFERHVSEKAQAAAAAPARGDQRPVVARMDVVIDRQTGMPMRTIAGPAVSDHIADDKKRVSPEIRRTIRNSRDGVDREWDRGKQDDAIGGRDRGREPRLSRETDLRRDRMAYPDHRAPVLGLEDLFRKTKTLPALYWLPLTEDQIEALRTKRAAAAAAREERVKKVMAARSRSVTPIRSRSRSPIRRRDSPPPVRRSPPPPRRSPPARRSPPPRRSSPARRSPPPRRSPDRRDRRRSPPVRRPRSYSRSPPPRRPSPPRRRR